MSEQANFDDLRLGCIIIIEDSGAASPLPLEATRVSGQIIGPVASVKVTQQFSNPFKTPIEIAYLFPLPHDAVIVDYVFTIGTRQIRADMKEVEHARRAYQEAAETGKRASLLEQQRPNLYRIQIANIQPDEKIICELHYEQRQSYQDGVYEFVFPMGITPRYHTPTLSADIARSADTAFAKPGEAVAPVTLQLSIDAGVQIGDPISTSHALTLERHDAQRLTVALAGENIPNKDFVLRYPIAAAEVIPAVWSCVDGESEIALISLLPPRLELDVKPEKREFVFVLDRSGSMSSEPMNQARHALQACLRALNPHDTFYIQAFDDKIEWMTKNATRVTQANVEAADTWLGGIQARGGTEILPAIEAALGLRTDNERQRYVVFLTDGAVSADEQAIRKIAKQRGSARIFTFGVGPSVNRFLLDKMAQLGRGKAEFVGVQDDIEKTITRFQDRVSYPALQDISLEWQNTDSWDTYPETIPDLYVGEPLQIVTRIKRKGTASVRLTGKRGQAVQKEFTIPASAEGSPTLSRIWARARVEALLDQQYGQQGSENQRQQIISVALQYRILTPFTAFVAVDNEVTSSGEAKLVEVSVPLPEGLDYDNFFGGATGGAQYYRMAAPGGAYLAAPMPAAPMHSLSMASPTYEETDDGDTHVLRKASAVLRDHLPKLRRSTATPAETSLNFASIEERIKWLARTQNVNGSWDDDGEMTAAALLAFVRAGHTTRVGDYRQQVKKAAFWLQNLLDQLTGFNGLLAVKALEELEAATGDVLISDSVKNQLPPPTSEVEKGMLHGTAPDVITSLDDLRLAAVINGSASAPDDLKQDDQNKLVQTWLAVGKPR
jgi:Ca-activated chloride channel homolog